jgi:hypothetical protein
MAPRSHGARSPSHHDQIWPWVLNPKEGNSTALIKGGVRGDKQGEREIENTYSRYKCG